MVYHATCIFVVENDKSSDHEYDNYRYQNECRIMQQQLFIQKHVKNHWKNIKNCYFNSGFLFKSYF